MPEGNGYDIYDIWDLGEFEQKNTRSTKWGSKEELLELSKVCKENGVGLYWDAVPNHKAGADNTERCMAVECDPEDRTKEISDPHEIEAWVGFDFPGRGDKYSAMKYHWYHFSGTDFNQENEKKAIYKFVGENKKGWSESVDDETGNADFLMFADLDYSNPEVEKDVMEWGVWIQKELNLSGFRLDAVQHFSQRYTNQWIANLREKCGEDQFIVGEVWQPDVNMMIGWLEGIEDQAKFLLYDSPLVWNFNKISTTEEGDLRTVFDGSLVKERPMNAVTLVMNHDTQPGQTVETHIEGYFKPLAYGLILLRQDGYPCVFYGDLYGMKGRGDEVKAEEPACGGQLADLTLARKLYAYGDQDDYLDDPNCIGFTRRGTWDKPDGLACVMSNAKPGQIKMAVGDLHKGEVWTDVLGWSKDEVTIDDDGFGLFPCPGLSMSVWVNKEAQGRDKFPVNFDANIYQE